MLALDIETAPEQGHPEEYALQPWRLIEGKARISNIAIAKDTGESMLVTKGYRTLLHSLAGSDVYTWNGVFDVAWLIAAGYWNEVKAIRWHDAMLLWKWGSNSQRKELMPAWSLADGAKNFFPKETWLPGFIKMKESNHEAGDDDKYWEMRAKLDAIVTAKISVAATEKLTPKQIHSAAIESETIPEVARSWVWGVKVDYDLVTEVLPVITNEMCEIEFRLGVSNAQNATESALFVTDPATWTPSKVLRSPKQLGELLYVKWKLTPKDFSDKTGAPKTDKAALTYLADQFDKCIEILRWRELNTQLTKYLQSPLKAREYLGSDIVHPAPKIFSTYTGRFTYASKTQRKYHTGIALHQWPRNKEFRRLIAPPEGYKHVEFDAAGQESRIMAHQSNDLAMVEVFKSNKKFHAMTGAKISGMSYEAFMKGREAGNQQINGEHGLYYQGKFINLSSNFRIGTKKMRIQARVQYGMDVDFLTVRGWQDAFARAYPGVKIYCGDAIKRAQATGYAETLGGRRFHLSNWSKEYRWGTESSAIMTPIQGTGADMKNLALRELSRHYPEFIFIYDLHDGLHMWVKNEVPNSTLMEARDMLDTMDYEKEWGVQVRIPLTWDVSVGPRWSELEEL